MFCLSVLGGVLIGYALCTKLGSVDTACPYFIFAFLFADSGGEPCGCLRAPTVNARVLLSPQAPLLAQEQPLRLFHERPSTVTRAR